MFFTILWLLRAVRVDLTVMALRTRTLAIERIDFIYSIGRMCVKGVQVEHCIYLLLSDILGLVGDG